MPLKLVPPRKGKSSFWSVRGTYLGVYVDRTTKAGKKNVAIQVLKKIEREIERGEFAQPAELTFAAAAHLRHLDAPRSRARYQGLVATGAWKDRKSADRYEHVVVSEEAMKAALLPTPEGMKMKSNSSPL